MKTYTKLYLATLVIILLYAVAYIFDFINIDFSYPDKYDDGVYVIFFMILYPIYTFIGGMFFLDFNMRFFKRIFCSFILASVALLTILTLSESSLLFL